MAAKKNSLIGKFVVCTTSTRPWCVVAGVLRSEESANGSTRVELTDARMIVYFAPESRSLFGVAAKGPKGASRVSPPVDVWRGYAVEQAIPATDEARAAIEAGPWR